MDELWTTVKKKQQKIKPNSAVATFGR
jgi:hypothetical protein